MSFRGTFEYALDAKHRLTIPPKYREELAGRVVIALWPELDGETRGQSLTIWPVAKHEQFVADALAGLPPLSPTTMKMRRTLTNNAWDGELDAAGRLMLPPPAIEFAKLDREVVLTGSGDFMEVWDRATHRAYNAELLRSFPTITADLDHAG